MIKEFTLIIYKPYLLVLQSKKYDNKGEPLNYPKPPYLLLPFGLSSSNSNLITFYIISQYG